MEKFNPIDIGDDVIEKWQTLVDLLASLFNVPSCLIMRLKDTDIEVFVSSKTSGNPYNPGDHEHFFNSGLYCETVINTGKQLLVPNALKDKNWDTNPDIKLGMVSYLGFPLKRPDGIPFGTICLLDNKENSYSEIFINILEKFRDIVQYQLELAYMNKILGTENKQLSEYIDEIKTLRSIIPICSHCKKVRDDKDYWESIEHYFEDRSDIHFTHGICPECTEKYYSDYISKKIDSDEETS